MSFNVELTDRFKKQAKKLVKKYTSLKDELGELVGSLEKRPEQGSPLGDGCFKIRLSITSKGKGKSGEARVITHVHVSGQTVYLVSIYDKSERESISDKELRQLLEDIG